MKKVRSRLVSNKLFNISQERDWPHQLGIYDGEDFHNSLSGTFANSEIGSDAASSKIVRHLPHNVVWKLFLLRNNDDGISYVNGGIVHSTYIESVCNPLLHKKRIFMYCHIDPKRRVVRNKSHWFARLP